MRSGRPPAQPPPGPLQLIRVAGREQEGRESWGRRRRLWFIKRKPNAAEHWGFHILSGFSMPEQW